MIEVCSLPSRPRNWRRITIAVYFFLLILSCTYWRDLNHYAVISAAILTFCVIHEYARTIAEGILTSIMISMGALTFVWFMTTLAHAYRFVDSSVLDNATQSYVTGASLIVICSGILAALLKLFWIQKNR